MTDRLMGERPFSDGQCRTVRRYAWSAVRARQRGPARVRGVVAGLNRGHRKLTNHCGRPP